MATFEALLHPDTPIPDSIAITTPPASAKSLPKNKVEMAKWLSKEYGILFIPEDLEIFERHNFGRQVAAEIKAPYLVSFFILRRMYALVRWYWRP